MKAPKEFALACCCGVIVIGPHLLAGATPFTAWIVAALAFSALCTALWAARHEERWRIVVPFGGVALGLHLYTLVQAAPLPCGWVDVLAPASAAATRTAFKLASSDAPWCSLSYDRGETVLSLAWTCATLSMLIATSVLIVLGERRALVKAIAFSTLAMALVAIAHRLWGASAVYGIYRPIYLSPRFMAPILNENHAGAFMALGVPLMIAFGVERQKKSEQMLWYSGASLIGVMSLLTLSRGAAAMLLLECMMFPALLRMRRRQEEGRGRARWVVAVSAVALVLGAYVAGQELLGEFQTGRSDKFSMIWSALMGTRGAPIFGFGRGAFGSAFTAIFGEVGRATHAENLPVQWIADWGWPAALFAFATIGWWLARSFVKSKSILQDGCLTALVALGAQNLVDFNVDMPGIAVVVAPLFVATVLPRRERDPAGFAGDNRFLQPRTLRTAYVFAVTVAAGLALSAWPSATAVAFEERQQQVQARATTSDTVRSLEAAMLRHTSDARYALLTAAAQLGVGSESAGGWIAFANRLAPGWAGPHVLEAHRQLNLKNATKAAHELRMAADRDPASVSTLICRVATSLVIKGQDTLQLLPEGPGAAIVADGMSDCYTLPLAVRERADAVAAERAPDAWPPHLRLAVAEAWNPRRVLHHLLPLAQRGNNKPEIYCLLSDAYQRLGDARQANAWIERGLQVSADRYQIHKHLAARYGKAGKVDLMRVQIEAMRQEASGRTEQLAYVYAKQGGLEATYGSPIEAIAAYEKAHRLMPRREWLNAISALAVQVNDPVRLAKVRSMLCQQGEAAYCQPISHILPGRLP